MTPDEIERLAMQAADIPDSLSPPQVMLYHTLAALYARYKIKAISKDEAHENKRKILSAYRRMEDEYRQFTEICKEYQRRIREASGRP